MFETPLFSSCQQINSNSNFELKNDDNQLCLDDIFVDCKSQKEYLKYKSIEDLEINELKDVLKSKEKINLWCDSALNSNSNNLENDEIEIFKILKYTENIIFDVKEKEELIYSKIRKYSNYEKTRQKKSEDQIKFLEEEFKKNPFWTKTKINELSKKLNLSFYQVYKWKWDNSFMI